jgi:Zn-dependent metalloprotease
VFAKSKFQKLTSILFVVAILLSSVQAPSALAQSQDGLKRQLNAGSGRVSFIGPENGRVLSAAKALGTYFRPQNPAMALANRYAPEFGIKNPARDLSELKRRRPEDGRVIVRYQQKYAGIPVMGGELIVNTNDNGDLYSLNGEVSPDLSLPTQPKIDSAQAKQTVLQALAKYYQKTPADFVASEPELWIFDESLLKPSTRPVELVWRMEVTAVDERIPVRELVLVNAERGGISLHFNQIDHAWSLSKKMDITQDAQPVSILQPIETVFTRIPPKETKSNDVSSVLNIAINEVTTLTGATWYVATTGNDSNACSTPALPCANISTAIAKAIPGDEIKVAEGTYYGNSGNVVTISKNITLSGGWNANFTAQTGASIIDGQNARNGILSNSSTVLVKRFVIQNSLSSDSGGIYVFGGNFTLENSTVRQNHATNRGGGIFLINNPLFYLVNSTISSNSASVSGGGIYVDSGSTIIENSTIAFNTSGTGGGLFVATGITSASNSIFAKNIATGNGADCSGTINSSSSIIQDTTNCTFGVYSGTGNQVNIDPGLDSSLTGTLPLYVLLTGSPAINSGNLSFCTSMDQRDMPRPRGSGCDIGAYEYAPTGGIGIISGAGQSARIDSAFGAPFIVYLVDKSAKLVSGATITFTAPISGASGAFDSTSTNVATVTTNSNGQATSPNFVANNTAGAYVVAATSVGVSETANFSLTNFGHEGGLYVSPTGLDTNSCLTPASSCASINEAINKAFTGDTVLVATGTYTGAGSEEVLLINKNLTLAGGWNNTFTVQNGTSIIDGQEARRGITVAHDISVLLDHFTIQNGNNIHGGGILNYGSLIINNTTIHHNMAGVSGSGSEGGGGIQNNGTLTLNNSTVNNNMVIGDFYGGGILNNGTAGLNNSTVSGNTGGHAGLYNQSVLTINNSTISGNQPYGIRNVGGYWAGTVTLKNTILAGNGTNGDCYGTIITQGYNLIGSKSAECTFTPTTGDVVGTSAAPVNPHLMLLQDNGGSTFTQALITGSPAINAGNPAVPGSGGNACLATDQRGVTRPGGIRCDIGSYEGSVQWTPSYHVSTYTAGGTSSLPGTFLCNETDPSCAVGDFRASAAHEYAIGTHNLYANQFLRNSLDNKGMTIISTVNYHFNNDYDNTFWNGSQVVYGDYAYHFLMADDVVAHELTHGVTQYESNLFYYYQSGAINESLSDLWGEYYDQTNDQGDDTSSVRWLVGEDVFAPGEFPGAYRSMSDPPTFGHPDKMSSNNYSKDGADSGGVHHNSGVNNKAAYLMVDGGAFNGKTITALGWVKTTAIYYETNTNLLSSGADYSDLYYALQQACSNLIGQKGITNADCIEVKDAIDAVEMNIQPAPNFNTDAPLCNIAGTVPNFIFADNLENGISNWTFTNGAYLRWQYDSPYGPYAHSGLHSLYADDYPDLITDASTILKSLVVPSNAYLHFAHAYGFESYSDNYDGGVIEYSTNNGLTWIDAGSLMDYNGYKGTVFTGAGNPLSGRSAFVGDSHGYISTRLNLASLAGKTVNFRWRMGLDSTGLAWGWWVDDVRVYDCTISIIGNSGVGGATLAYTDNGPKSVLSDASGNYTIKVPFGWTGTVTPKKIGFQFTPANKSYSNVQSNQTAQNYTAAVCPTCADKDTVGVFRPGNGALYLRNLNVTGFADVAINYGLGGDYPVLGDWDGNGTDTIGIYRNGTFYLRNSNTLGFANITVAFGSLGDQPIAGDWDGDGIDTIGLYRSSTGTFLLRNSNTPGAPDLTFALGNVGDVGIAGDWNGDGIDTTGVFRPSNGVIFLKNKNESGFADVALNYGLPGDQPVVGDWDNNGTTTIGIYRNARFYLRNSNTNGFANIQLDLGNVGDMPIAGNWDAKP